MSWCSSGNFISMITSVGGGQISCTVDTSGDEIRVNIPDGTVIKEGAWYWLSFTIEDNASSKANGSNWLYMNGEPQNVFLMLSSGGTALPLSAIIMSHSNSVPNNVNVDVLVYRIMGAFFTVVNQIVPMSQMPTIDPPAPTCYIPMVNMQSSEYKGAQWSPDTSLRVSVTSRNRSNEALPGFVAPDTTTLSTNANGVMSVVTASDDDFDTYLGI